jgi:PTS system nitrogen regulatory IIA component
VDEARRARRAAHERFGAALRLLRLGSGRGVRALAREVGVSAAYISRVEAGLEPPPSAERLVALATALGLPTDLLEELAGRVAPDLIEYLHARPAALRLLRALQYADPSDRVLHRLAAQVERGKRDEVAARLAASVDRALALDAPPGGDPLEEAARAFALHSVAAEHLLDDLRARGVVTDASSGQRVAIVHAAAEGLEEVALVLVRRPAAPRLVLGLAHPPAAVRRRVAALGALARLASDERALDALERAAPRTVVRVLRHELRRVLGLARDRAG